VEAQDKLDNLGALRPSKSKPDKHYERGTPTTKRANEYQPEE